MTRREHLRAWATDVVRDGLARGILKRGKSAEEILAYVLAEAKRDLVADALYVAAEVATDVGLGALEAGLGALKNRLGRR